LIGLYNGGDARSFLSPRFSTTEEAFLHDNSTIYERASFRRRPSQLQHEMTSLNALGPPSHVLKARRLSKTTMNSSSSTPITPVKSLSSSTIRDKRKPSIVDNYSKEFGNNSAVSPRFMALRKLSEVTTVCSIKSNINIFLFIFYSPTQLPSHSISSSAVPPVPQIPPLYNTTAGDPITMIPKIESLVVLMISLKLNYNFILVKLSGEHLRVILKHVDFGKNKKRKCLDLLRL
jgi:hypothetical protein